MSSYWIRVGPKSSMIGFFIQRGKFRHRDRERERRIAFEDTETYIVKNTIRRQGLPAVTTT